MKNEEALLQIADATAEAVAKVLRGLLGDVVDRGPAAILPPGSNPLSTVVFPSLITSISYTGLVSGGNIVAMPRAAVRRWAAAMMGLDEPPEESEEFHELEQSAMSEATNQMMAAAAATMSVILGQEIDITPPETELYTTPEQAAGVFPSTPHATGVSFAALGETCRLIQLIPNAFVVRMAHAFTELSSNITDEALDLNGRHTLVSTDELRGVDVRVHVELGRSRMQLGRAVGLRPRAVVELDRDTDAPIDIYVSGRLFAHGRLLEDADGRWAVRIERLLTASRPSAQRAA